ncbi:MAG: HD-GYP domain-containing protein [Nitrospirae bacterium]|nr:HD-GYP domain-containing protein [Candidatus Manganitrophaceae bacterium]
MRTYDEERAQLGKHLINQLAILIKTSQIHDAGNIALKQPAENFCKTLDDLFVDDPEVSLNLEGDTLYLGDMKLKLDIDVFTNFMLISEEMKKREVGGMVFSRGIGEGEIRKFSSLFSCLDPRLPDPFERLQKEMERASLQNPQILLWEEKEENEELKEQSEDLFKDNKELAKKTYFNTVTAVGEVMDSVKLRQAVSLKRAKRVVQSMVDLLLQEDSTLLGLTTLRSHDEYTYNHSVNVCILALAIGQRLGYSKKRLCELGMAGLFHDLGKFGIPLDVLNKPSDFTEEEWKIMRRHPIFSVKELVRLKGVNDMAIRVMIGAFEHHLNYDLSGYPKLATKRNLSLIGRIICIVDCYDALTSSRVYNRVPFAPDKALRFMLSKSGKAFDPILMKLFVNAIGVYPIGTLVLLNTREVGVVYSSNPNPERGDRPKIKRVIDASGNETEGEIIDLCEQDENGHFKYEIVKMIDATQYKIDVARYFV